MGILGFFNTKSSHSNKAFGDIGEDIAESFLISTGHKILERNFKCKQGEIDIIAKIDSIIVFIEVKTRSTINFGYPEEAVTLTKQRHISKVANYYIHKNKLSKLSYRADIVAIVTNNSTPEINHIIDAFALIS